MKKIISLLLSITILAAPSINAFAASSDIPVYSSVEEWLSAKDNSPHVRIQSRSRSGTDYVDYVLVESGTYNNVRIGYHPSFKDWRYVDGYYFSSNKTVTLSSSITVSVYKNVSVSLQVSAASGGAGYFIAANSSRESRPWVRADITANTYDIYGYDGMGNQVAYVPKGYTAVTSTSNVEIFIDYR